MTRYWIIAPYDSKIHEIFEATWDYDVKNNTIAIGWNDLGDISKLFFKSLLISSFTNWSRS